MKPLRSILFAAMLVAALVVFSCSNERGGFFSRLFKKGSGVPVTVESVVARDKTPSVSIPAAIEAVETATISIPEEATIDRVPVNEGSTVAAGDVVLRLSEEEVQAKLAKLRADQREAQAKADRAAYTLKNRDRLLEEERIDRAQFDAAESDAQAADADVDKLKQEIARLEGRAADLTVKSPIAGVVTKRSIAPGLTAKAGDPLLVITKIDPAIASFPMAPEEAASVRAGTPVRLRIPLLPGAATAGQVVSVGSQLNAESGTFTVRASIPNPRGVYKQGMQAVIEIESPRTQHVQVIPEEALIRDARGYFVFTVADGVAHRVQVIPGEARDRSVEITRGLRDEDVVVVRGQDKLAEGTVVDIWGR